MLVNFGIFVVVFLFASTLQSDISSQSPRLGVAEILEQISESDRNDLDQFFQLLIQQNEMGYTLFGSKPITVYTFFKKSYSYPFAEYCLVFENGWTAWRKNMHLFPTENFVFKTEESGISTKRTNLYLINKKHTLDMICKHLDSFKENLGPEITPREILDRLCSNEPVESILSSQFLLGFFLGYGENNARIFQRVSELHETLSVAIYPPFSIKKAFNYRLCQRAQEELQYMQSQSILQRDRSRLPKNRESFSSCMQEFDHLMSTRKSFSLIGGDDHLEKFKSLNFVFWDDQETNQLQSSYAKTRAVLVEVYATGSFLENTLNQWVFCNEY